MKLQSGKSAYAFVNMKDGASAASFKEACDAGKLVLLDDRKRHWAVGADWAKSNGRSGPKDKAKYVKPKDLKEPAETAGETPQKKTLDFLPIDTLLANAKAKEKATAKRKGKVQKEPKEM
jgi:hypothetical protein